MPLHPQVQAYLDQLSAVSFADLHTIAPERARQGMRRLAQTLPEGESVASVVDQVIATDAGSLPVRVYRPKADSPQPLIVFFHGGGFVLGDLDTHDGLARALANRCGSVVVSVDYPLAPEHKFPAAPIAAYAATRWVAEHATELGGDPARLAVAGDSAGGNLATVVALRARDEGTPSIGFQLLIYPDLDFRRVNHSIREFAGRYGNVSRETQHWFMDNYLTNPEQKLEPQVSPLLAPNLRGLPPTLIITAEYDALRDEGEQYGQRLRDAGVAVEVRRYDGMIHEFLRQSFETSSLAIADAAQALREAFELDQARSAPTTWT